MSGTAVVCDLDGVLYVGERAVAGAAEALRKLEELGHQVLFCTNNATRSDADTARRIARLTGYPAQPDQVLTSAMAAAAVLASDPQPCLVVGGSGIRHALDRVGVPVVEDWRSARVVVVGLTTDLTYGMIRSATAAVRAGARLIATNLDATFPMPDGLWPGAGAIVAAIETASGRTAEVAGKPNRPMRELIAGKVGDRVVWVVGDRPETDLAMARGGGWHTALVLTGVTSSADGVEPVPDLVLGSLEELPDHLL